MNCSNVQRGNWSHAPCPGCVPCWVDEFAFELYVFLSFGLMFLYFFTARRN